MNRTAWPAHHDPDHGHSEVVESQREGWAAASERERLVLQTAGVTYAAVGKVDAATTSKEAQHADDVHNRFTVAAERARHLATKPTNAVLLRLYGLYKRATGETAPAKSPSSFQVVAKKKWEAWHAVDSLTQEEARVAYIRLVASLSGDELHADSVTTLSPAESERAAPAAAAAPFVESQVQPVTALQPPDPDSTSPAAAGAVVPLEQPLAPEASALRSPKPDTSHADSMAAMAALPFMVEPQAAATFPSCPHSTAIALSIDVLMRLRQRFGDLEPGRVYTRDVS